MAQGIRVSLIVVVIFTTMAVAFFVYLSTRINGYTAHIKEITSRASGMKVSLRGGLSARLYPRIGIIAKEVRISKDPLLTVNFSDIAADLDIASLFGQKLKIKTLRLVSPMAIPLLAMSVPSYNFWGIHPATPVLFLPIYLASG